MQTASEIMAIGERNAAELFPGDAASVRKAFRKLVTRWHPDRNSDPKAKDVFAHIVLLKESAMRRAGGSKRAQTSKERTYRTAEGKSYVFRYMASRPGDLGEVHVGRNSIAYEIREGFEDIAEAETRRIEEFRYADDAMRREMERFLPKTKASWHLEKAGRISVLSKPDDTVLLADLVDHLGGKIPAVHAAWIISGMLNLACYLHWSGLSHGAISGTTVLVCPQYHSVLLAGGWGFATAYGKRPSALPERTTSAIPRLSVKGTVTDPTVDLQLVRVTAQEMLGAPGGGGLALDKEVPDAMRQWLLMTPMQDAYKDYAAWSECLLKSFGKRRFVEMGVSPMDVYEI